MDFTLQALAGRLLKRLLQSLVSLTSSGTKREIKVERNGWQFSVRVDGDDLVVDNTTATWFGGDNDPLDNGETASGVMTKGNPHVLGCALPVVPSHPSTAGSPLAFSPRIPWKTKVLVEHKDKILVVELLDNGPAKSAGDGIDLTPAAFKFFAPIEKGVIDVSYRIIGAAKYVK